MEPNLPTTRDETGLVLGTTHDLHDAQHDPQQQVVQQNLRVALLPLAIVAFAIVAFIAAAWTFLAALPAG